MELGDALAWLDRHQNLERMLADSRQAVPDPTRMRRFAHVLGDPPGAAPAIHLTWFEIMTGAAFRWFADRPVDASVIEVGLGGRWDATNVANGIVAVVTNVGLDHTE